MTKSTGRSLIVLGIAAVLLAMVVLWLTRTGTQFTPAGERALPQTLEEKLFGPAVSAKPEYSAITKLSIGMTEDAFKILRPNARPSVGIDEEHGQAQKRTQARDKLKYEEFCGLDGAIHRFIAMYYFEKGKLISFSIGWEPKEEDSLSTAALVVKRARERYGKEHEQIIRDERWSLPNSPPNLCPELIWHIGDSTMRVSITAIPRGDLRIGFLATGGTLPVDTLDPPIPVSEAEKRQVFEKFGIPLP